MVNIMVAPELLQLIVSFLSETSGDAEDVWPDVPRPTAAAKRQLAKLRLVSWDFWAVATPVLLEQLAIVYEPQASNSEMLALARVICEGPGRDFVREVKVGFGPGTDRPFPDLASFVRDLAVLLPVFLSQLPNVESLVIRGPAKCATYPRAAEWERDAYDRAVRSFPDAIFDALRYVKLPRLTRLSVFFPMGKDLDGLSDGTRSEVVTPIGDLAERLRYLDIKMYGFGGWSPYAPVTLRLFERTTAMDLEHLSITRAGKVPLDDYIEGRRFSRLHTLRLASTKLSAGAFISILKHSARTLRHIDLESVSLTDGRWDRVLSKMLRLGRLCHFRTEKCGYAARGASNHLRQVPDADVGLRPDIRTASEADLDTLGSVELMVFRNRGKVGLEQRTETYYAMCRNPPKMEPKDEPSSPFNQRAGFDEE